MGARQRDVLIENVPIVSGPHCGESCFTATSTRCYRRCPARSGSRSASPSAAARSSARTACASRREWFRRVIMKSSDISGYWRTASTIAKLNNLLAMDCSLYQLEMHDKQLALRERHRYTQARQFLIPIAQSIAELIANGDLALIKCCANPPCTLWFYDRTKGHRRRFCSTTVCGNRIKVAAFRLRQRKAK